jgi:DNA-binding transcriptional ArsR family regulator
MSRHERADATPDDSTGRLPDDAVADLLASERRRRIFAVLRGTDGPLAVTDLAQRIATLEATSDGERGAEVASADTLREEIYQNHLPKLTATDVVTYDSLVGTVELATEDDRLLDPATEDDRSLDPDGCE